MTRTEREVQELGEAFGFTHLDATGRHLKLVHPSGDVGVVFASRTPSDHRWKENLARDLRAALRKAGRDRPRRRRRTEREEPMPEHACQHCGQECADARGLSSHEDTCDQNPNLYHTCRYCGKPCKGKRGLGQHERRFCPERPDRTGEDAGSDVSGAERDAPEPEPRREPVKAAERPERNGLDRAALRDMLLTFLDDMDEARDALDVRGLVNVLDTTVDLILEQNGGGK